MRTSRVLFHSYGTARAGQSLLAACFLAGAMLSPAFGQVRAPAPVPGAHGSLVDPGFGRRLAATVAGRPVGVHPVAPAPGHFRRSTVVAVPYPVYVGGGYYGGGYYGDPSAAPGPAPVPDPGAGQPAPVVIINQSFQPQPVNPVIRDYSGAQLPPAADQQTLRTLENPTHPYADAQEQPPAAAQQPADDEKPTLYLIAFKDHRIVPALAYWVDGDTVSYVTKDGSQNRVSLSLIDREFSKQLNDERRVPFKLPQ